MLGRVLSLIAYTGFMLNVAACGGGGGGAGPANPPANPPPTGGTPFGLTARASLATFDLPVTGTGLGTYTLANAYPSLSFSGAVFATGVPDENRMVVVRQNGYVEVFTDDPSTTTSRTVLDISGTITSGGELGLLGMAFDPAFSQNRYIYLNYTTGSGTTLRTVISRMSWPTNTDVIEPSSEKLLLEILQPYTNHNAGMLAFGPDDFLYIATGDGGSGGDPQNFAQNMNSLLGKILRIDVHPANSSDAYDIPADNPFVSDPSTADEIYASGLRNPFRFSFDRQTGDLWLGDVGQNEIEEIDIITAGGNYGWRVFEGTNPFNNNGNTLPNSAFTDPVYEYNHSLGISVIGGYVYRGTTNASLFGRYLYSDFGSGTVWALDYDGSQVVTNDAIATAASPTSFAETNSGEVLVVSRNNGLFELQNNSGSGSLPNLLSDTGLFTNLQNLTPASGLIEYTPNHSFWSDGTMKRRWVGIPDGETVEFSDTDWVFPTGTVTVKHFEIELTEGDPNSSKRLETRVFVHSGAQGWLGFTYRWNSSETDADLLTARATEVLDINTSAGQISQRYEYPSPTDCLRCHNDAGGFALGLSTPQLNGDFNYSGVVDNQLRSWNNIGLFDADIGEASSYDSFPARDATSVNLDERARTYLQVNCSNCHRPGGPTPSTMDLRTGIALNNTNTVDVTPVGSDLGITNAVLIAPGERNRSMVWQRMQVLDGNRMPPLGSHVVDELGLTLIGDWIDSL